MQIKSLAYRSLSLFICFAVANLAVPQSLVLAVGQPINAAIDKKIAANAADKKALDKRKALSRTQPLTEKQMNALQGRSAQCPYTTGASKWDPQFEGVDLITGNYSTTATDLSFDGGYGIPVNITRSYSANDPNEGPFGWGWSLSADVRMTAGGILKGKSGPVRSVPANFKERSSLESDPNVTTQPVEAVTATDASGKEETIQKDADGVLSPPAWDQNKTVSTYQPVVVNSFSYQILAAETITTPDGTVYQYQAQGSYTNGGTYPYGQPTAAHTPSNILKCMSVTDRNGNTTTYSYGSTLVSFQKTDGTTSEYPLTAISMPNHHTIYLTWGTVTGGTAQRVMSVYDTGYSATVPNYAAAHVRTVNYTYNSAGYLLSATSPGNMTTQYGYSAPYNNFNTDTSLNVLSSITSPQGLTTNIASFVGIGYVAPYGSAVESTMVYQITEPNLVYTQFIWQNNSGYDPVYSATVPGSVCWYQRFAPGSSNPIGSYYNNVTSSGNSLLVQQETYTAMATVNYGDGATTQADYYDFWTQNNTSSTSTDYMVKEALPVDSLSIRRQLLGAAFTSTSVTTNNSYNFQGKPLDTTVTETEQPVGGVTTNNRVATTSYAYWGADKYYQQMAVKDPGGRISFTDYYSNLTTANNPVSTWGQKYRVWDPKYGGTSAGSGAGTDGWRYTVSAVPNQYSGQFSYDSKGRATSVQKLQAATPGSLSTYSYVTTSMTYGADNDGSWGQAVSTIEDSGGLNRTTTTHGFTAWGKANDTVDAAGHEFQTSYDPDGKINYVSQVGVGNVATYAYGEHGVISNGLPTTVTDNLSGVTQSMQYIVSGSGVGLPLTVTESRGGTVDNVCTYGYNTAGDRSTSTYTDGSGNLLSKWGFFDYLTLGTTSKPSRVYQTMTKLDSAGNRTSEEFHYAYDTQGRILECAFAQTPSQNGAGAGGWYDTKLAATRCRAHYEYDPAGRLYWVGHYWDTLTNGYYASQAILGQCCDFEVNTASNRGVKLHSKYETPSAPGSSTFQISQTDTFSYDSSLDYLTGANYGDGLANATQAWTYDAAGNRNDAVTDNLNRVTSIGGIACTNDPLGNRLTKGTNSYSWDQLNRLKNFNSTTYIYRADGMRISKSNSTGSTSYRYDGQMGIQDTEFAANGSVSKVTDYGIAARGIDGIYVNQNGTTSACYPIYDTHGNMIATISRQGSGNFATAALRTYDAWGQIRIGAQSGDPKARYCGKVGHKQDDESGLIYMRARFYEPQCGRFISEDPAKHGLNWFGYADNNPCSNLDVDGKETFGEFLGTCVFILGLLTMMFGIAFPDPASAIRQIAEGKMAIGAFVGFLKANFANDLELISKGFMQWSKLLDGRQFTNAFAALGQMEGMQPALAGIAGRAIAAVAGYAEMVQGVGMYMGLW